MQVSYADDHITHAVVGGKQAINFGISEDPAFFQILSSALYKDPMLAMVRETICNAWDAHIDSGRTDRPLMITLDDEHLCIRDFGKGIPDSLIGPIYGVYGASTKKNDGRQTGGFGLGCKSPFSYTDHFEVTSWHAGLKTIYSMSKSSGQVQGKPSITPLASFKTDETGIQVRIPLVEDKQNHRLYSLVRQVVLNGDIKAIFNGDLLPTIGLDIAENGFILLHKHNHSEVDLEHLKDDIYVRYGNVIYPVDDSAEYSELYKLVNNIVSYKYSCRLILQAEPDSISITPSRESLTMSDITVATIKDLFNKFMAQFHRNVAIATRHREFVDDYVQAAIHESDTIHNKLEISKWVVPGVPDTTCEAILRNNDQFAMLEVIRRYSHASKLDANIYVKYMGDYLSGLAQLGDLDRGLVHSWISTANKAHALMSNPRNYHRGYATNIKNRKMRHYSEREHATAWWRKHILLPLVRKLLKASKFDINKLMYFSPLMTSKVDSWQRRDNVPIGVSQVAIPNHTYNLSSLLKSAIVACHNAKLINKRLPDTQTLGMGQIFFGNFFVYEVTRKKGEAEDVLAMLRAVDGLEVIDMTGRTEQEQAIYEERQAMVAYARAQAAAGKPVPTKALKKTKPGLFRFDQLVVSDRRIDTHMFLDLQDPERVEKPTFIEKISTAASGRNQLSTYSNTEVSWAIAKLYGKEGAVTNKSDVYERYIKKGAMKLEDYVLSKLLPLVEHSPTLKPHHTASISKIKKYIDGKFDHYQQYAIEPIIDLISSIPMLHDLLPGLVKLSDDDQLRVVIWEHVRYSYPHSSKHDVVRIAAAVDALDLDPALQAVIDKMFTDNKYLRLVNINELKSFFKRNREDDVAINKATAFLQSILN